MIRRSLLVLVLASCDSTQIQSVGGSVSAPAQVEFEPTFVGFTSTVHVDVANASRFNREVTVSVKAPFELESDRVTLAGGSVSSIAVTFRPTTASAHEGVLQLGVDGELLSVVLTAHGLEVPACESSGCTERHFEPGRGCVETDRPEGTRCETGNQCVQNGVCQRGTCIGAAVNCDDGNACTTDACAPATGCTHETIACQAQTDPCLASACDPVMGCRALPVVDGTSCGANDCQTARVCMNGACVARASPEGSVCAPATTCRAESRCVNGACTAPDASTPPLAFRYTAPAGKRISGHVVARDGALFFLESGNPVKLMAFEKTGAPRFELDLSADAPSLGSGESLMIDEANGRLFVTTMFGPGTEAPPNGITTFVQAFELRTGRLLWKRDVSTDVPHVDGPRRVFLVQRLVLLNGGKVGVFGMEGDSLHQLHVVALDGATGSKVFQVQRAGHGDAGVTRNGTLFMRHFGCWSQQAFLTTFDDAGRQMTSIERGVHFSGFAEDAAVVWDGRRLEVLGAGLTSGTAIPVPVGHEQLSAVAWSPTESILLTKSSGGFHATSAVGQTIAWSTLVTPNRAAALSFQRLDLGRTAVFVHNPAAMVELVVLASNGAETARCLLPSSTLSISGGSTVAASGNTLSLYSTPDLDTARTGWVGRNGGPQGTNRAQ